MTMIKQIASYSIGLLMLSISATYARVSTTVSQVDAYVKERERMLKTNEQENEKKATSVVQESDQQQDETRSVDTTVQKESSSSTPFDVDFGPALSWHVNGSARFLLGARDAITDNPYALSMAWSVVYPTGIDLSITPLAPVKDVTVNGAPAAGPSPLLGKAIDAIALCGAFPVVHAVDEKSVYYLKNLSGTDVLSKELYDASGSQTEAIVGLAASNDTIFAAVSQTGAAFSDPFADDRGIALVQRDNATSPTKLEQKDPANIATPNNTAYKLDVTDAGPLLVDATAGLRARFGEKVVMHWSEDLKRLYVGFTQTRRDNRHVAGGIMGVLVGRFDGNQFKLDPLISGPVKASFYNDTDASKQNRIDGVVGFYADGKPAGLGNDQALGNSAISVSISQLTTMKTTTGRHYLLVASAIEGNGKKKSGLYYVPLASGLVSPDENGKIANHDFSAVTNIFDQLPHVATNSVDVTLLADDIQSITVQADTVLLSLAGSSMRKQGLYQTTALFAANGSIIGWTPLAAVAAVGDKTYAGAYNYLTGNYVAVHGTGVRNNVLSSTQWASGSDAAAQLASIINKHFGSTPVEQKSGVRGIYSYDAFTSGFEVGKFSLMIVLGYDKVMLIETMKEGIPAASFTDDVSDPDCNVRIFASDDLTSIAPLTCAAMTIDDFAGDHDLTIKVGGYRGVCRLQQAAGTARGWEVTSSRLASLNDIATYTFVSDASALVRSGEVRSLASSDHDNQLYVYAHDYAAKLGGVDLPAAALQPDEYVFDGLVIDAQGADARNNSIIIATNKGLRLHRCINTGGVFGSEAANVKTLPNEEEALALVYTSSAKGNNHVNNGILYVLGGNLTANTGHVYRYAVDITATDVNGILTPITNADGSSTEELIDLVTFKRWMMTDGLACLTTRDGSIDNQKVVSLSSTIDVTASTDITQMLLDLDLQSNLNAPVRDVVSGMVLVPGRFGVRLNQ